MAGIALSLLRWTYVATNALLFRANYSMFPISYRHSVLNIAKKKGMEVRALLGIDRHLEESKELSGWVACRLDGQRIPSLPHDKRLQLAMACQHLAIEHAQGIICLVDHQFQGAALALQRPMFEAVIRGVWLRYTATDNQLDQAAEGKFPRTDKLVRDSPPASDKNETPPLSALKDRWWRLLCGYTHGGSEQILARLDSSGLRANYQPDEVIGALRWSDMIHLYCGVEIIDAVRDEALVRDFIERMNRVRQVSET